jgi:hypothetical protein
MSCGILLREEKKQYEDDTPAIKTIQHLYRKRTPKKEAEYHNILYFNLN